MKATIEIERRVIYSISIEVSKVEFDGLAELQGETIKEGDQYYHMITSCLSDSDAIDVRDDIELLNVENR